MSDIEIIRQLEEKLNRKIPLMEKDDFHQGGFRINGEDKVIELYLYDYIIYSLEEVVVIIKKLSKLRVLAITNTKISDISIIKELKQLTYLILEGNQIRDISPLGYLENLTTLDLSANQISDISALSNLKDIMHLYLKGLKIK